jgi:glycosyltransferase involved in cell wall biosynthesis
MNSISVIVPTIWAHAPFSSQIEMVAALPQIKEIIVIDNNHGERLPIHHPKIKVLVQEKNIFVNPAWNRGAKESTGEILCFMNDDLFVRPEVFPYVEQLFQADEKREIGLVGLDWDHPGGSITHENVMTRDSPYFGCLMFMRSSEFTCVPRLLKIWHGDDYFLLRAILRKRQVFALRGYADFMQSSSVATTKIREKIEPVLVRDSMLWNRYIRRLMLIRHQPISTLAAYIRRRLV